MAARERPLSPHLQVYRPMYTMALSISHRITGVGLTIGLLLFAWWLLALATGPEAYARVGAFVGSPFGLLVLAGFAAAYWYHFFAGIRHLVWDTGRGLEKPQARRSAVIVLAATAAFTLLSIVAIALARGAA